MSDPRWFLRVVLLAGLVLAAPVAARAGASPTFERDVRPILKAHCFHCHGEKAKPKGRLDLRLVRTMKKGGTSGAAVVPGTEKKACSGLKSTRMRCLR